MKANSLSTHILGVILVASAVGVAEPAVPANPTYAMIVGARAAGDTRAVLRALPQVEGLWPKAPQAYFQCLKQVAEFLISGPARTTGGFGEPPPEPPLTEIPLRNPATASEAAAAMAAIFERVMEKDWSAPANDTITCLELKRDILSVCCNVERVRTNRSSLMALARFVGENRSLILPEYTSPAPELAAAARQILTRAAAPDRSALADATLAQQYDRLMQKSARDSVTNRLQSVLRESDRYLTLSLLACCAALPPADRRNFEFLGEVAAAAKLAKAECSELGLDSKQSAGAPALPARTEYSIGNYNRTAAQWSNIVARVAPPDQVGAAIQAVLQERRLDDSGKADWPQLRSKAAAVVLTNLALLEAGLRLAATATNVSPEPPWHKINALQSGRPGETNRDPEIVAYANAVATSRQFESLTRALDDIRSTYWDRGIDTVASAYSRPPPAEGEFRSLLATYAGFDCTVQLSNRLHHKQLQRARQP